MSSTAHVGLVRQAVRACDAELPKPVADALAARDAVVASAKQLPLGGHAEMMAAVTDAIVAGRDPLDDKQVRRLVVARILIGEGSGDLSYSVGRAADERVAAAVAENVEPIVVTFKTAVDSAGRVLAEAVGLFGDVDLGDSNLILRMGPKASGLWSDAKEAVKKIGLIDSGWHALATLTQFASANTSRAIRLSDCSLEQSERLGHRAETWAIVRSGLVIDMAATDEAIAERVQRHAAEREARQTQRDGAFTEQYRKVHGFGRV